MKNREPLILKEIEAVIFDLDGSLVDSMWIWPAVDRAYLEKYHLTQPDNFHEGMEGKSYTEVAQYFLDVFPELDCTIEEVKQEWTDMVYEAYTHQVKLKTGAYHFITHLRERGMKFGIATSNARELTEAALEALHVKEYFDSVHTSCEVKTRGCGYAPWKMSFPDRSCRRKESWLIIILWIITILRRAPTRYYDGAGILTNLQGRYAGTGMGQCRFCICVRRCLCRSSILWTCNYNTGTFRSRLPCGNHSTTGLERQKKYYGIWRTQVGLSGVRRKYGLYGKPLFCVKKTA